MLDAINRVPAGLAHYFGREHKGQKINRQDASEKDGEWFGNGAKEIGLTGRIDIDDFRGVAYGNAPDGTRLKRRRSLRLNNDLIDVQKAGTEMVLHPPKAASMLMLVGGDRRIESVCSNATRLVLEDIEENCSQAQIRTGGKRVRIVTGNVVAGVFDHYTSRATKEAVPMPQYHQHAMVFGVTHCPDGVWRRMENELFFKKERHRLKCKYAEAIELGMRQLGYGIEWRDIDKFGVDGISHQQEMFYSSRAKVLADSLGDHLSEFSYKQVRTELLKTRLPKQDLSWDYLHKEWNLIAVSAKIDWESIDGFVHTPELQAKPIDLDMPLINPIREIPLTISDEEAMDLIRPPHLTKKHWKELVIDSGIDPAIAAASFRSLNGDECFEYLLEEKLAQMGGHAQQYATQEVTKLLKSHRGLQDGGLWVKGLGDWGELKPNTPRKDRKISKRNIQTKTRYIKLAEDRIKDRKYEAKHGVEKRIIVPYGPVRDWDDIKKDTSQALGITEGGKKAHSMTSHGLYTIGISGMNGAVLNGDLREDLKDVDWKGRQVFIVLDKDPISKQDTLSDSAREKYKLGAILDAYGARVYIGTIPGDPEKKIGIDDHLVAGKNLRDVKWQSIDRFVATDPHLRPKYKAHNEERHKFIQKNSPRKTRRRR